MSIFGVYTFGLTFYLALGLTGSVKRALGLTLIYLGIYFFLFIITDLPDDFLDYLFFIIVLFVALLAGKIKEKKYECRPLNDYGFEFKEFYFYTNIRDGINEQKKDGTLWHDNKSGDESLCYAVFNEKNDFSWGIKFKKSCNVFGIKLYSPVLFTILLEPGRPFYNIDQNVIDIINRAFFHLKKPKWDILQSGAILMMLLMRFIMMIME